MADPLNLKKLRFVIITNTRLTQTFCSTSATLKQKFQSDFLFKRKLQNIVRLITIFSNLQFSNLLRYNLHRKFLLKLKIKKPFYN